MFLLFILLCGIPSSITQGVVLVNCRSSCKLSFHNEHALRNILIVPTSDKTYSKIVNELYSHNDVNAFVKDFVIGKVLPNHRHHHVHHRSLKAIAPRYNQWYLKTIKADKVWKLTKGSRNTIVAILDSGVDYTHPDLSNTREGNEDIYDYGYNFGGCTTQPNPYDIQGHGTHIAGVIAANLNNFGITGIAPNVKIMSLRVTDCSGNIWASAVLKALDYAYTMNASIVVTSFGGIYPPNFSPVVQAPKYHKDMSIIFESSLKTLASRNIIVIAAAGNENINLDNLDKYEYFYSPCLQSKVLSNVICVKSSSQSGNVSSYSNFGLDGYSIVAPGEDIISTSYNHTYRNMTGTSMATAVAAGTLALVLNYKHVNNNVSLIKHAMITSSQPTLDAQQLFKNLNK
uniref:Peptidase S8/S53 domain-containing protein n=1 Tax=viral metagenome TaxID=1070528 RepID=A0A6C0BEQ8_9ZZZZ